MPGKYSDGRPLIPDGFIVPITGTVAWLSTAGLPDGRIVAVWSNGGPGQNDSGSEVRARIYASPEALTIEPPVAASTGTVILSGETFFSLGAWVVGNEFFVNALVNNGGTYQNRLYVGDALNPLGGLTIRQVLDSGDSSAGILAAESGIPGTPMVIGSRWILPSPSVSSFASNAFTRFGVYVSENGGATFTQKVDVGFYLVGGSYKTGMSTGVLTLPNGNLLVLGFGTVDGVCYATSSDNGASWSTAFQAFEVAMEPYIHYAILNDGASAYAARHGGGIYKIGNDGLATEFVGPTPGWSHFANPLRADEWPLYGRLVYSVFPNRLLVPPARGWQMGSVAL